MNQATPELGNAQRCGNATLTPIYGGASGRRFLRITARTCGRDPVVRLVVMVIPMAEISSFDAYCANGDYLRGEGIPVPSLHGAWRNQGIALLEDFGNTTLTRALAANPSCHREQYGAAIALLVRLHACKPNPRYPCPAFSLHFDPAKWMFEYQFHVREWLIGRHWGIVPDRRESKTLHTAFSWLSGELSRQPRVLTHRDYQSSNLLVRDDGSLGLVDFQDARQGLRQYDLASLLYDSYVAITEGQREDYSLLYSEMAGLTVSKDEHDYLLRLAAIQRKLHDAGAFSFAAYGRGKADFLRYIPDAVAQSVSLMDGVTRLREAGQLLSRFAAQPRREPLR